jgi:transcriptional accessory protein Tex/SPT6
MDVDAKRQRISLTMRLNDAPGNAPRPSEARVEANPNFARGQSNRQPPETKRPPNRAPQLTGLFALALEKAKVKK